MSSSQASKTLQRRLFGSHLLVILVALAVLAVGALLVVGLLEIVGGGRTFNRGSRNGSGPFGLLVGGVAAVIASGLVSWRVSRQLAAPLEAISDATRELAVGRYDVRVPGADTAELNAVAADVNELAEELRTSEERRLRLIGDVAHELRNPLSTIEGTMEALVDGVVEPDDQTFLRIGREAARLRRLADDLSSLSSAGELGIAERLVVDMAEVAKGAVAQLQPQAEAKGLSLAIDAGKSHNVLGDVDRLLQVLINVIGNAIQYTDAGGVSVMLSGADPVVLEISDTGRGLSTADQAQIFERFYRVNNQVSDGTGVGLAISKLLVEAHGGAVSATSPGLERGTSIRIELPAAVSS